MEDSHEFSEFTFRSFRMTLFVSDLFPKIAQMEVASESLSTLSLAQSKLKGYASPQAEHKAQGHRWPLGNSQAVPGPSISFIVADVSLGPVEIVWFADVICCKRCFQDAHVLMSLER